MQKWALRFFQDSWASIGVFVGVAIMTIETVSQLYSTGAVSLSNALLIGLGLFVFFGIAAIFQYARKAADAERKFEELKNSNELSKVNSAKNGGIAIERAKNSPVVQASSGGFASAGNINLTQNFFPPTILQSISAPVSGGRIEVKNIPDNNGFKFAVLNDTNNDLRNCVVYIDEIAYKSDEDKSWNRLDDLPSEKPLRWITTVLPTIDGSYDIDAGKRLSFVMIKKTSSGYFLDFFKENVLLPYGNARSHRILIRFDGKLLLSGRVTNKFYVYFYEEILGQKIYYGIEEYPK